MCLLFHFLVGYYPGRRRRWRRRVAWLSLLTSWNPKTKKGKDQETANQSPTQTQTQSNQQSTSHNMPFHFHSHVVVFYCTRRGVVGIGNPEFSWAMLGAESTTSPPTCKLTPQCLWGPNPTMPSLFFVKSYNTTEASLSFLVRPVNSSLSR